jgi:hypothetical protein
MGSSKNQKARLEEGNALLSNVVAIGAGQTILWNVQEFAFVNGTKGKIMWKMLVAIVSWASLVAGNAQTAENALNPAAALGDLPSYSWTATVSPLEGSTKAMVIEGATERDGPTALTIRFGGRTIHGYSLENKTYITSPNTNWRDALEHRKFESPAKFMTRTIRRIIPPTQQIVRLVGSAAQLRKEGELYSGELSESVAKRLLNPERQSGSDAPAIQKATGNVKIWTRDGVVSRYEFSARGKVNAEGKETDLAQTTIVEIKDVGTTKVMLPEQVRQKVGSR